MFETHWANAVPTVDKRSGHCLFHNSRSRFSVALTALQLTAVHFYVEIRSVLVFSWDYAVRADLVGSGRD